jgi:predicted enzyme related to lactoylglutathione lyase
MPIRDDYEPGRPCWVDLGTTDPDAARAFYTEMFGWSAEVDPRPEAGGYAQFLHDGHPVAGVGPIVAEGMPPSWTTYIATADADATAEAITANGGTLLQPPFDVLDAGRMAVFAGPEGAVAGIWQAGKHAGAQFVTETGGWNWSQLLTRDKDAALAFYGAVFDWRLAEDPTWGEYIALGDNGEIAGATQMGNDFPSDVPPQWEASFLVNDAYAFVERAQGLGATPQGPAIDAPMNGRSAALADPQGASFRVMSFPAQPG